jgi:broad specificity phosphatase PhoE
VVTIVFELHGTSLDNENHVASGRHDVALSPRGERQAKELGKRYKKDDFDAVFCSDLQRSYRTAELAFSDTTVPIIKDHRLRECDYGHWTRRPSAEIERERVHRIEQPFPNGESYEQTTERTRDFLVYLLQKYDRKRVLIIGHRATQYGLEHCINRVPLQEIISAPWQWKPGWTYTLTVTS